MNIYQTLCSNQLNYIWKQGRLKKNDQNVKFHSLVIQYSHSQYTCMHRSCHTKESRNKAHSRQFRASNIGFTELFYLFLTSVRFLSFYWAVFVLLVWNLVESVLRKEFVTSKERTKSQDGENYLGEAVNKRWPTKDKNKENRVS